MKQRTKKYEDSLIESLKNPVEAAAYLTVHIEDNSKYSNETFLLALQDVAKAYGIKEVSKKAKVGRESLYKTLSGSVNPKLNTLRSILDSVGLKMTITPKDSQAV
ncbi:MAG: putative addiction module antidote protein [Bdellovibrionales bacterium]|nr:putative addiction module antidote protein [Bdellovibrionales bacterium]